MRAVVDWVAIRVTLPAPTQARHLRERMPPRWGKPFVEPAEGQRDESCSVFIIHVQDPNPMTLLEEVQGLALGGASIRESSIQILGVEVAIDLRSTDSETLAPAALYLFQHLAHPPFGTPRITTPSHYEAAASRRNTLKAFVNGWSVNIGEMDDSTRARVYVKRHDSTPGESHALLPECDHRARIETTLTGKDCPFSTLEGFRQFRFETLAKYFAQVLLRAPKTKFIGLMHERMLQHGRTHDQAKREQHRRQRQSHTVRDSVFNDRIRIALRNLTKRNKKAGIRTVTEPLASIAAEADTTKPSVAPKYFNTETHTRAMKTGGPSHPATPTGPRLNKQARAPPVDLAPPRQTHGRTEAHREVYLGVPDATYKDLHIERVPASRGQRFQQQTHPVRT
jgi:hypothetical protein